MLVCKEILQFYDEKFLIIKKINKFLIFNIFKYFVYLYKNISFTREVKRDTVIIE